MKNKLYYTSFGNLRFAISIIFTLGVLDIPASAEFEKWTNKEGRSVSMEFVRLVDKDGEKAAEFKLVNGKPATIKLSTLAEADVKRLNPEQPPKEPEATGNAATEGLSVCDDAIQKMRAGKTLSEEEIKKCSEDFARYYEGLSKKYETTYNTAFPDQVRTEFYINAVKMALITPAEHGGWPTVSPLRMLTLGGLKKRIEEKNEPFAILGAIIPSLDNGDQDYAAQAMNKLLKNDQYLAKVAGKWLCDFRIKDMEEAKKYETFFKLTGLKLNPPKKKPETQSEDTEK